LTKTFGLLLWGGNVCLTCLEPWLNFMMPWPKHLAYFLPQRLINHVSQWTVPKHWLLGGGLPQRLIKSQTIGKTNNLKCSRARESKVLNR
jgi:hypothetical protein